MTDFYSLCYEYQNKKLFQLFFLFKLSVGQKIELINFVQCLIYTPFFFFYRNMQYVYIFMQNLQFVISYI